MEDILSQTSQKFSKVLEVVKNDLATIRTGKATPVIIETLFVEAYGTKMKLNELATVNATDATTLLITPFDIGNINSIIKAIQEANLGLTATSDETHIRVIVPALSEERRNEYVKLAKTKVEGGKVMVRQIRHESMEDVSKSNTDEDTQKHLEKEIQKLTDEMVEKLELMASEKEAELIKI